LAWLCLATLCRCLSILLDYASHANAKIRKIAITTALKTSINGVQEATEEHAKALLAKLGTTNASASTTAAMDVVKANGAIDLSTIKQEQQQPQIQPTDGSAPEDGEDCIRNLELFLELCTRKHELLFTYVVAVVAVTVAVSEHHQMATSNREGGIDGICITFGESITDC
jgi:hypothetical protein